MSLFWTSSLVTDYPSKDRPQPICQRIPGLREKQVDIQEILPLLRIACCVRKYTYISAVAFHMDMNPGWSLLIPRPATLKSIPRSAAKKA